MGLTCPEASKSQMTPMAEINGKASLPTKNLPLMCICFVAGQISFHSWYNTVRRILGSSTVSGKIEVQHSIDSNHRAVSAPGNGPRAVWHRTHVHTLSFRSLFTREWGWGSAFVISICLTVLQDPFCYPHFTERQTEAEINRAPQQVRGSKVSASKAVHSPPL